MFRFATKGSGRPSTFFEKSNFENFFRKCPETGRTAKSFEHGKCLETGKTAKSFERGKCLETGKTAKSLWSKKLHPLMRGTE